VVGVGRNRRRFSIRAVHRDPVDVDKLARAFIEVAKSVPNFSPKTQETGRTLDSNEYTFDT